MHALSERRADLEPGHRPDAPRWWRTLLACEDSAERRAIIASGIKARLPARGLKIESETWELTWALSRLENPIDALAAFDDRLEARARELGIELHPRDATLEAFLSSDDAHTLHHVWRKRIAAEKLIGWLSSEDACAAGESASIDALWSTRRARNPTGFIAGDIPRLYFQLFASTERAPRRALSREEILTFDQDLRAGRRHLHPSERGLVEWIASHEASIGAEAVVEGWMPVRNALDWLTRFGKDRLIAWKDGGPCSLDPTPTCLGISEGTGSAPNSAPEWVVSVGSASPGADRPTSIPLALAELLEASTDDAVGERAVFLRSGDALSILETRGMPVDVLSLLVRAPELPVEKLRGASAGAFLVRRFLESDESKDKTPLFDTVPVKPAVEIELKDETTYIVSASARASTFPSSEIATELVRTHSGAWIPRVRGARSPDDGERPRRAALRPFDSLPGEPFHDAHVPESRPRVRAPDAIAVVPRKEDIARVEGWLEQLIPRTAARIMREDGTCAFAWKADAASTLRLVRQWIARPPGVEYSGDDSFQKLVAVQDAPRLEVSVRAEAIDWLEVGVEMEEELASLSLSEIADALETSDRDILVFRGARLYRREHLENLKRELESLQSIGLTPRRGKRRIHASSIAGTPAEHLLERFAPKDLRLALGAFTGIPPAPVDPHVSAFLRPYQRTGADFLVFATRVFGGALLADDMGLGKTLQTLAALTGLRALDPREQLPSLVICPASVARNWEREARRFCPHLRIAVVEGGEKRRQILSRLADYDLVIQNFALTRRDVDILKLQPWLLVVIDEAQAIKNPGAEITRAVKQLLARHRVALTGTPIENRLTDLWSIVDFLAPGHLGSLASFERDVKEQDSDALQATLRARLRPLLLRRLKREVAPELPPRIEECLECEMTDGQRKAYLAEVKRTRMLLESDGEELGQGSASPGASTGWNGEKRIQMLAALTRLRQICCEPSLVDLPDRGSGKLDELMVLLPELLSAGHKVLLFSQFVQMLNLLRARFEADGMPFHLLTGLTEDRMQVVDAFEGDPSPSVFLISLKAGGTGLNLTSASHVILYDPWWSPALEAQAIDRAHRIGQDKTVIAVRLVTRGTIEERILELQERKRSLVRAVLESGSTDGALTRDDFEFLLAAEPSRPSACLLSIGSPDREDYGAR